MIYVFVCSTQACEYGYRRVGGVLQGGQCEPCDCNSHAVECSDYTGQCYVSMQMRNLILKCVP